MKTSTERGDECGRQCQVSQRGPAQAERSRSGYVLWEIVRTQSRSGVLWEELWALARKLQDIRQGSYHIRFSKTTESRLDGIFMWLPGTVDAEWVYFSCSYSYASAQNTVLPHAVCAHVILLNPQRINTWRPAYSSLLREALVHLTFRLCSPRLMLPRSV